MARPSAAATRACPPRPLRRSLVIRHKLVPGEPLTQPTAEHGKAVGTFLRALHDCPAPADLPDTDHAPFAEALAATYGVTADQHERAYAWHQLGPWYEVTYGKDIGDPETVQEGLDGVVRRLLRQA